MTVDEYLATAPAPQRGTLNRLRSTLREILPEAEETISYGMPAFKVDGKAVAGYAWFKGHCSYSPHSSTVLPEIADDLDGYEWSKGALKFPVDDPPPDSLVRKLVEVRLAELGSG